MKTISKRIITYIIIPLPLIFVFVILKWSDGYVVIENHTYRYYKETDELERGLAIVGTVNPVAIIEHEERPPLNLYSKVTPWGANISLTLTSQEPLTKAHIDGYVVFDDRGRTDMLEYQVQDLHEQMGGAEFTSARITMHPFGYLVMKGPGRVEISGYVVFSGTEEIQRFKSNVTFEALRSNSIVTRKTWDQFMNEDNFSTWRDL